MLDVLELVVGNEHIVQIYDEGFTQIELDNPLPINSYLVLRSLADPQMTTIARHHGNGLLVRVHHKHRKHRTDIVARDSHQVAFADALTNKDIIVNIAVGTAGTGKTTLAIAHATERYLALGKHIYLTKPTAMVGRGKAFGPIPGDIQEKYAPYLASYEIVLKKVLGKSAKTYLETMKHKQHLKYIPIELVRGCTFEGCTFIIDEAQNLNWHELNTIISRMGEGTEVIVLGDLNQIDTNMMRNQTGLFQLANSEKFQRSPITSAIMLKNQYRSPITKLIAEIDEELRER